jgi:hypothetical protein
LTGDEAVDADDGVVGGGEVEVEGVEGGCGPEFPWKRTIAPIIAPTRPKEPEIQAAFIVLSLMTDLLPLRNSRSLPYTALVCTARHGLRLITSLTQFGFRTNSPFGGGSILGPRIPASYRFLLPPASRYRLKERCCLRGSLHLSHVHSTAAHND